MDIRNVLKDRILVLDGAMGTMIQRLKLEEADFRGDRFADHAMSQKGNNDLLCLTQPVAIQNIHEAYLEAGADIIETNTFNANRISMADYGMESVVYEMNVEAAKLAKAAADKFTLLNPEKPRFVAGALGPTNKTASMSPDVNDPGFRGVNYQELVDIYTEQAKGLIDGGADILLVETVFDTLNAKAALYALVSLFETIGKEYPIMVSGTITDASGRTLSGQTTEAFLISISHAPLLSIGLNCALGAEQLRPYVEILADKATCFTSAHPNAGLPNEFGEYDQGPEQMASQVKPFLTSGWLNIIGGCCGTTPEHIKEMAKVAAEGKTRTLSKDSQNTLQL